MALVIVGVAGCGQNAFQESAKKDTDAALLFEARKEMNNSKWTEAITLIGRMTATSQSDRGTKAALASAYAGRCGLNLIRLANEVSSSGGSGLFAVLMVAMRAATASSISDCQQAETLLLSISNAPADRSADENVMLAFIGFAKIGAVLATYADTNDDGRADASFDSCNAAQLPDAALREIGTGMTLAVSALAASGGSIGTAATATVASTCTQLAAINPAFNFCAVTDAAAFTVPQVKALGALVKSSDNPGLGTCAGTLATCVCP